MAREDRIAASQMKRLVALQDGLLESWELLPEECRPLLDEDIFTIVGEIEGAARLARRRAALRRHLESMDRRSISKRIKELQKDLARLEPGSPMRAPFESALEGRRGELAGYADVLGGISMINAQLESAESLLGNLRGELLALDDSLISGLAGPRPRAAQGADRVLPPRPRRGDAARRDPTRYGKDVGEMNEDRSTTRQSFFSRVFAGNHGRAREPLSTQPRRSVRVRRGWASSEGRGARLHRRAGGRGHKEPPAGGAEALRRAHRAGDAGGRGHRHRRTGESSTRARESRLNSEIDLSEGRIQQLKDETEEVIRNLEDEIRKAREARNFGVSEEERKIPGRRDGPGQYRPGARLLRPATGRDPAGRGRPSRLLDRRRDSLPGRRRR